MISLDNVIFTSEKYKSHAAFWKQQLENSSCHFRIIHNEIEKNVEKADVSFTLCEESSNKIKELAKQSEEGEFVILISVVSFLVARFSRQNDVIISTPQYKIHNSPQSLNEEIPLFLKVSQDIALNEWFRDVQTVISNSYNFQNYPLSLISDVDKAFTTDVSFAYSKIHLHDLEDRNYDLNIHVDKKNGCFDFQVSVKNTLQYCLFGETLKDCIETVLNHHSSSVLKDICLSDDRNDSTLDNEEIKEVSFQELFENVVKQFPEAVAIESLGEKITYSLLNSEVNKVSEYLKRSYGLRNGQVVGILLNRSVNSVIALLAIIKTGAAFSFIDPSYPKNRRDYIIKDLSPVLLIVDQNTMFEISDYDGPVEAIDIVLPALNDTVTDIKTEHDPSEPAYIIYTSGSTGFPKGCVQSKHNLLNYLTWACSFYFNADEGNFPLFTSLSFDLTITSVFCALMRGKCLHIYSDSVETPSLLKNIFSGENNIDVVKLTPSHISALGLLDVQKTNVKTVIVGGEALRKSHINVLRKINPDIRIANEYGPTETTVGCTAGWILSEDNIHIGKAINNTQIYIVDNYDNLCPYGYPGEICVSGLGVGLGYLNNETQTKERFVVNRRNNSSIIYRTGDVAFQHINGHLFYLGRKDNQIKLNGFRVELSEITAVLSENTNVTDAVTIAFEENGSLSIASFVVSPDQLNLETIKSNLRGYLPEYMLPRYLFQLDSIFLTSNGKTNESALQEYIRQVKSQTRVNCISPRTASEKMLLEIINESLGVEELGVTDNFFAFGLDSLKAIRIVLTINTRCNSAITVSDLFLNPTIEKLSQILSTSHDKLALLMEAGYQKIRSVKEAVENKLPPLSEEYEDIYPLSPIETGMIYSSLIRPEEPVYYDNFLYNVQVSDMNSLKEALKVMVNRHTVLRSRYYLSRFSEPVKIVLSDIELPLEVEDLSKLPAAEQKSAIKKYLDKDLSLRLGFEGDLLWHMRIFRLSELDHYIVWSVHHAMLDGWSIAVFKQEISRLLDKQLSEKAPLVPLKHSYKDYCAVVLGKSLDPDSVSFWKNYLAGYTRNKLPFNYTGKRRRENTGMSIVRKNLPKQLLSDLLRFSTDNNMSVKTVCLAAHVFLMHLVCSENDVVTGIVSHDRPVIEDSDKILGCFLNTIPVRLKVNELKTKKDLLDKVNEYLLNVPMYEMHLTDIANAIKEKASIGNPIFDCILNFTDFHISSEEQINPVIKWSEIGLDTTEFIKAEMTNTLFDLEVDKTTDHLHVKIKYVDAYFDRPDMAYLIELYERILNSLINNTEGELSTVRLLNDNEFNEIVFDFNNTILQYSEESTLHKLFEKRVSETPYNIALIYKGESLTYDELNKKVNRLARFLIDRGVKNGDNIGLIAKRGPDMIVGMLAILKTGSAYVPIEPDYPEERKKYLISNSGVNVVLIDRGSKAMDLPTVTFLTVNHDEVGKYATHNLDLIKSSKDLAYTIYTSGSTGQPKGVMIEHHSAVNLVEWVNTRFNINEADRMLFVTSMCFDLSVYDIFGILAAGGSMYIADKDDVQDFGKLKEILTSGGITFWDSVPTTMNYLIGEIEATTDGFLQHDLRLVFMSGDWIPVPLPQKVKKYFPNAEVVSLGGATEATVWSNYFVIDKVESEWSSIPYGKPITNNFFYILNEFLQPVPVGVVGELYIGGVGVARGYANDAIKTNSSFIKNPFTDISGGMMYKTGDLGRLMRDGNMEFLGRKDHQVKIRGFRVELGEIESAVLRFSGANEAVTQIKKDNKGEPYLCAYVVSDVNIQMEKLNEFLITQLPSYMVPSSYMQIDFIPLTENGKIDRKALPEPTIKKSERKSSEPINEIEKKLIEFWQQILNIKDIGVYDSCIDLGAHSLNIAAFVNRVNITFGVSVSLRDVFLHPAVSEMAKLITTKDKPAYKPIEPAPQSTYYEASLSQKRLWVAIRSGEDSAMYNINTAYILEGQINIDALAEAFNDLLLRHEILRTGLLISNGELVQQIYTLSESKFKLTYFDCNEELDEDKIKEIVSREFNKVFDFSGMLFRAGCYRISVQRYLLIFSMHHIISDGLSVGIITRELMKNYSARLNNVPAQVAPLKIQYKDYAHWQNQILAGDSENTYWKEQFEKPVSSLNLPLDFERPRIKTYNGNKVHFSLSKELTLSVNVMAQKIGSSPFIVLMSVYNLFIHKITGQNDIVVGFPVSGRDHIDLEDQVGFYVNMLPLRTVIENKKSFAGLLQYVKENMLLAYEHQYYPFNKIVEKANTMHKHRRAAIYETGFTWLTEHNTVNKNDTDVGVRPYHVHTENARNDLWLFAKAGDDCIYLSFEYNTDLFKKESILVFIDQFTGLCEAVVKDPDTGIEHYTASVTDKYLTQDVNLNIGFDF